jgi:hypothetical protein
MALPLDAVMAFHNAFRRDMEGIDAAALGSARGRPGAVGVMANVIPQARFPEVIAWLFPLLSHDDRENMVRIREMVMPPPAMAQATQLAREAVGADWAELTRRVPALRSRPDYLHTTA